jgi:dsDNA-binding SOS-regulon protein
MADLANEIKEILPLPQTTQPVTDPNKEELHTDSQETPTLSHALATQAAHSPNEVMEETGVAQENHEDEVVDLGWNEPASQIANPLIGGMRNEDLWLLVRRFNKVSTMVSYMDKGVY